MVTENNSQINTFVKGMNSDTSYQMLDEQSYALAENLRLFSLGDGNKHGELRPIPGLKVAFEYAKYDCDYILAATSIRQYGIIIARLTNKKWKVYRFENQDDRSDKFSIPKNLTCIFTSKGTTESKKFDVVTRYEDDDNVKLYIADGNNPIMCLNITEVYSSLLSEDDISSYPQVTFNVPKFEGYTSGTLKSGLVQYSYRLYKKNATYTDISPCTNLIPIYGVDGRGLLENEDSGRGVKISIDIEYTKNFDYIQIYRIHYSINGQNPTVSLICDQQLQEDHLSDFSIVDNGIQSLQTITLEEYNSFSGIHVIPKTIESQNDYLFAGCIKSEEGVLQDEFILNWDARAYSYNANGICTVKNENGTGALSFKIVKEEGSTEYIYVDSSDETKVVHPENTDGFTDYVDMSVDRDVINPQEDCVYDMYGQLGGTGKNVSWKFIFKNGGVLDTNKITSELDYGEISKGVVRGSTSQRSLKRGELYRYGIVLYDKYGSASPVKWIADIRVPSEKEYPSIVNGVIQAIGLEFHVDPPTYVDRYEIVRCNRSFGDIKNISQGVISLPGASFECDDYARPKTTLIGSMNPYTPTGFISTNKYTIWDQEEPNKVNNSGKMYSNSMNEGLYQFVSPEVCFNKEYMRTVLKNKDLSLKPVRLLLSTRLDDDKYSYNTMKEPKSEEVALTPFEGSGFDRQTGNHTNTHSYGVYISNRKLVSEWGFDGRGIKYKDDSSYINNWVNAKKRSFAYIKLYNTKDLTDSNSSSIRIKNSSFPEDPKWDQFINKSGSSYNSDYVSNQTSCGSYSFSNWVTGTAYGADPKDFFNETRLWNSEGTGNWHNGLNVYGIGGRCLLLNVDKLFTSVNERGVTYLCNIQHEIRPYGGYSRQAKEGSVYYSYGNYGTLIRSLPTGPIPFPIGENLQVFDGDAYINAFEYISMHKIYSPDDIGTLASTSVIYSIPVETNINLDLTSGYEFSRENDSNKSSLQIEPSNVYNVLIQSKPAYEYNSVYSSSAKARMFVSQLSDSSEYYRNFDYRVRHSNVKSNDERLDSWLRFQSADYIDVDTKHGPITNLKSHQNRLYFWQKDAVGLLSVNERTVMNTENNLPLIIGEGGVLTRYDYIDEHSGMYEDQFCTAQSSNLLYYFDDQNQTIKALQGGTIVDLPATKNVKNIMIENESNTNSPIMFFDDQYDEMIANVFDDKAIVYNEKVTAFTSLYTIGFDGVIQFPNRTYLIKNDKIGNKVKFAQWNILNGNNPSGFDSTALNIKLKYVVNKTVATTKVFDNQEIVTSSPNDANFDELQYKWTTDLNMSTTDQLEITDREGNFRFAIPRSGNSTYGSRIRGKYMVCEIEGSPRSDKTSISYIITKLRGSFA